MKNKKTTSKWKLGYHHFDPKIEGRREALCTLGNGYFCTRGAAEESEADEVHYPGTYLAGGYNRLESKIAGKKISNEDLVNFPNWLPLSFRPEKGTWFKLSEAEILSYHQELDLYQGLLSRKVRFRDKEGRISSVKSRRLVHMANPHLAALEYKISAENWSGKIRVKSALDGSVSNAGVTRYRKLNSKHLKTISLGQKEKNQIYLLVQTKQSHIQVAQTARTEIFYPQRGIEVKTYTYREEESISQEFAFELKKNKTVTIEKMVTFYTSRDRAISECLLDARLALKRCGRFEELLKSHFLAWKSLWRRCDIKLNPPNKEQLPLRLHIFHLLQSVSPNSIGSDVGVPARGLHGEAYRGHIFWDELFIFPFYNFRIPEISRSLLMYRYQRLEAARQYGKKMGYRGAMYPWQSGSNGEEETQTLHLNPISNTWTPDHSRLQRHVNAAIVYNIWQYFLITGDREFMINYGAEMILEIARFWSSITTYNIQTKSYEIKGVMGPDEYHEKYPDSGEPGLKNNVYTNIMAVWVMERAREALKLLAPERRRELIEQLELTEQEIKRWEEISRKMTIPFQKNGIINQFEGYNRLIEFDWETYCKKYKNIERLDRILKSEGDSPDRYKVSKQADLLMLFYLFPPKELRRIFEQLGYKFEDEIIRKNIDYYMKRTAHGSTLSKIVHASVLDRIHRTAAWDLFREALQSDLTDIQGGTTPEGIHLGAMAGTVHIVLYHYAGIDTAGKIIAFHPRLPKHLFGLNFRLRYHSQWYELDINHKRLRLTLDENHPETVKVNVKGTIYRLKPGTTQEFSLFPKEVNIR